MSNEEIRQKTSNWNPDNDLELAGILLTISSVAKRLAKLLLDQSTS